MSLTGFDEFERRVQTGCFNSSNCRLTYGWLGEGPPVVLINGLGGTFHLFYKTFLALSDKYRVIGYNHRGESGDGSTPGEFSHDDLVNDFEALCGHLRLEQFDLLGYSFGGTVAQKFVLRHPERVRKLFLASTFARRPLSWYEKLLTKTVWSTSLPIHRLPCRRLFSRYLHCRYLYRVDPARVCFLCDNSMGTPARSLARRALLVNEFDNRARLNEIHCPALLLRGEKDGIVPSRFFQELRDGLPHASSVTFPGAGHFVLLEAPDEYHRILLEFLENPESARR